MRVLGRFRTEKGTVPIGFAERSGSNEFTISTYGGNRRMERSDRKPGRKKELSKKVELSWGFEELREKLN